ncbi:MAG: DUF4411 family protein [Acidothermus cellulolyticus]|nr:DUF4411 family protein [Acidothermus cellulolyticus]
MAYLLDANVFIAAKNQHYGFDFCPAFWDWLAREYQAGKIFSIDKVREELREGGDDLARWVDALPTGFFLKPTTAVKRTLREVADWVINQSHYEEAARSTFLNDVDYYLVAQALAGAHVLITHEKPTNSKRRVKIPDVCRGVGVEYAAPFDMLRREKARFVLEVRS